MKSGELYGVAARGGQNNFRHALAAMWAFKTWPPLLWDLLSRVRAHFAIDPIQLSSLAVTIVMIDPGEP